MGCFSFICKECGNAILSNSYSGQKVKLFLIQDGEIIQQIEGEYNSYGSVLTNDRCNSIEWKNPNKENKGDAWNNICDLMFSVDKSNGIAAVHSNCYISDPKTRSEDDPNQGWGEDFDYLDSTDKDEIYG